MTEVGKEHITLLSCEIDVSNDLCCRVLLCSSPSDRHLPEQSGKVAHGGRQPPHAAAGNDVRECAGKERNWPYFLTGNCSIILSAAVVSSSRSATRSADSSS